MESSIKKNILFFQSSILPSDGGVPRVSEIISKELTSRGYNCYFVYHDKDNQDFSPQMKLKVDLKRPSKDLIFQFIRENEIDFFICQNVYEFAFIDIYKKIRSYYPEKPFICFLHASPDYWATYKLKSDFSGHKFFINFTKKTLKQIIYPFYNPYVKSTSELYSLCDKFILLSNSFKQSFFKLYLKNRSDDKLHIIPNPLTFSDSILQKEFNDKENIVLIVSRLDEHQKKILVALKIWQKVQEDNKDWKLFIVGSGPDEAFYRQYVSDEKISNVTFFGHKVNVLEYYKQASIFMMTSIWEGLPMALLEARQNGVVPISFDNFSAIHDVISDGENGYIIHDNSIEQFVEKLSCLMKNNEIRQNMAFKAIESSKRFNVTNVVDEWERVLHQSSKTSK